MLHLFETKIQEKNLELITKYDPRIPTVIVGDPVRLHQIILNLMSNAVKFTAFGRITVQVALVEESETDATVSFSISDTGIGIGEDNIKKIFETFRQASSDTARLYGGTGLGLAIVKQLVESQGGSIDVKSKIGAGSTFTFTLKFQKTTINTELEAEEEALNTELKNIKILVVEDMALNQLLMKTLLDDFGFEREIASNGRIAIEKLKTDSYDIILMDLQMPVMNGFETTEYIRKEMNSQIPIIALTADVTTVDLAKCKAIGMNDYIAKPVDERLLFNKIVGLLKKSPNVRFGKGEDKRHTEQSLKCIDLTSLNHRTKSNPELMMEIISLYLEQTPPLIESMRQGLDHKDWSLLYSAVHKMIPSFSIMGIHVDYENMAKAIQDGSKAQSLTGEMHEMVLELEKVCVQACNELRDEYVRIKNTIS
jgi:CheY-like chemotaxis protein